MEKINLNVARGGSDSIMTTFSFVKQEIVPLGKSLLVLVLPLIAVGFCLRSFFGESLTMGTDSAESFSQLKNRFSELLETSVVYLWMHLVIINYMKAYLDKFRRGDFSPVLVSEVWQMACSRFWTSLGVYVLIFLGVFAGMLLFLIPGIYLSVCWAFALYCLIFKGTSVGGSLTASKSLVKGRWWNVCLYFLLLYLISGILTSVFYLPFLVVEIVRSVTGEAMAYGDAVAYYCLNLGQYLIMALIVVGGGIRFCSYWEQEEHEVLLDKIGKMGQNQPEKQTEDEGER